MKVVVLVAAGCGALSEAQSRSGWIQVALSTRDRSWLCVVAIRAGSGWQFASALWLEEDGPPRLIDDHSQSSTRQHHQGLFADVDDADDGVHIAGLESHLQWTRSGSTVIETTGFIEATGASRKDHSGSHGTTACEHAGRPSRPTLSGTVVHAGWSRTQKTEPVSGSVLSTTTTDAVWWRTPRTCSRCAQED